MFAAHTHLIRSVGTFLYGRRLYETMAPWETDVALAAQSDLTADFATAWQVANTVVHSSTLAAVSTAATRLERRFDAASVRNLKASASSDHVILLGITGHREQADGRLDGRRQTPNP